MKLRNVWFKHKADSGEKIAFQVPVTVTTDGMFNMMVPKEYREALESVDGADYYRGGVRFSASSLRELQNIVEHALEEYLAYKTVDEVIIRYNVRATCHYCEDKKGNIYPNGGVMEKAVGNYKWTKSLGASSFEPLDENYVVSLVAQPYRKETHTRGKIYEKVDFHGLSWQEEKEFLGEYGCLLNGFQDAGIPDDAREMPYTEDAAKFFYLSMMSLCKLDSGVKKFFVDEKKVLKEIKSGSTGLLLTGGN